MLFHVFHSQHSCADLLPVYRRPPTPEEIVLHTRETKERLHALSQPSEEPGAGQKPVSTLRKTLG